MGATFLRNIFPFFALCCLTSNRCNHEEQKSLRGAYAATNRHFLYANLRGSHIRGLRSVTSHLPSHDSSGAGVQSSIHTSVHRSLLQFKQANVYFCLISLCLFTHLILLQPAFANCFFDGLLFFLLLQQILPEVCSKLSMCWSILLNQEFIA